MKTLQKQNGLKISESDPHCLIKVQNCAHVTLCHQHNSAQLINESGTICAGTSMLILVQELKWSCLHKLSKETHV